MPLQVASCGERTRLPAGEAAAKVRSLLKEQNSFEAAMHVARMGSRTGSRPVRKSFGGTSDFYSRFALHHLLPVVMTTCLSFLFLLAALVFLSPLLDWRLHWHRCCFSHILF